MRKTLALLLLSISPSLLAAEAAKPILSSSLTFAPTYSTGMVEHDFPVHSIMKSFKSNTGRPMVDIDTKYVWSDEQETDIEVPNNVFTMWSEVELDFPVDVKASTPNGVKTFKVSNVEVDTRKTYIYKAKSGLCEVRMEPRFYDNNNNSVEYEFAIIGNTDLLDEYTIKNAFQNENYGTISATTKDMKKINSCVLDALLEGGSLGTIKMPASLTLRDSENEIKIINNNSNRIPAKDKVNTGAYAQ